MAVKRKASAKRKPGKAESKIRAAVDEARAAIGTVPQQFFVVSVLLHNAIEDRFGDKITNKEATDDEIEAGKMKLEYSTDRISIHVCESWKGYRWEVCDKKRLDEIFGLHAFLEDSPL